MCAPGGVFDVDAKQQDEAFVCETLVPTMPLKHGFYHCDKRFQVEQLLPYFQDHTSVSAIGVVLISGERTDIYRATGTRYELLDRITVHRQKRQKKGGQSAHRFQFIRLEQIQQYVKKIAERLNACFVDGDYGKLKVEHIAVGGVGDAIKSQVLCSPHLLKLVADSIKANVAIADMDIHLDRFLTMCRGELKQATEHKDTLELKRFYNLLNMSPNTVVYGCLLLDKYINEGMLKQLLVAAELREQDEWMQRKQRAEEIGCSVRFLQGTDAAFREGYGGAVGILWHAVSDDVRESVENPTSTAVEHDDDRNGENTEVVDELKSFL